MDDRGRLAQSLIRVVRRQTSLAANSGVPVPAEDDGTNLAPSASTKFLKDRLSLLDRRLPRGLGWSGTALLLVATLVYALVRGDHVGDLAELAQKTRDSLLNVAGLRIASIELSGNQHVSREEVLAIAGITGATSLIFLNVEDVRERLKRSAWISDATVFKLYPRELKISIKERAAYALWQKEHVVSVIADDGTVLEPYVAPRLLRLPLVVGSGAQAKAKEIIALINGHPSIRDLVRACVFVGNRRWNLRLRNGLEVRLPETGVAEALELLARLEREKHLISRDIVIVDLRLPDRVTVRLSDSAAQARSDVMREKLKKKAGNA
jgi:cell division protein FtsQ